MTGTLPGKQISFGPFRLDAANARLLRGAVPVAITPKAFDVLQYLASRPDQLVTKDELLSAVWPDVIVSDASIKVCVREIRKALDDGAKTPTYIETVHRRGYRFIAPVADAENPGARATTPPSDSHGAASAVSHTPSQPGSAESMAAARPAPPPSEPLVPLVGRDAEMRQLLDCLRQARAGRRQCVFVSGGPGGGKTMLAEAFARIASMGGAPDDPPTVVLTGHCFQQFGTSEPYMPVWEALARSAGERPSPVVAALLARHADAYAPAPSSADRPGHAASEPRAMSERLLRELADGIEALAADAPLILLLEDVHWADYSTVDLVSALARRRTPARLMVIATYRPTEVLHAEHPLRGAIRGLAGSGNCTTIDLDFLDEDAVTIFLAGRFGGADFPPALAKRLHQRTDGHPLFLVHLVDDLVEQGVITRTGDAWHVAGADGGDADESSGDDEAAGWLAVLETHIPQTVRAMIESHLERLDRPARHVLEAAAVAGVEFSAAAAAAALAGDVVHAEQACEDLARSFRFLEAGGVAEWPDGTAASQYRFVHELYHNVVYEEIPAARRVRMHQLVGLTLESAWDGRAAEEAAGLAMHFEMARDWHRAVKYLRLAAGAANRHYAHREAAHYLSRALAAVDRLPEADRDEHELEVLKCLGVNLQVTRGFAADEVQAVHARAYALCRAGSGAASDVARTFPVLWGIWLFHKVRSDLKQAATMCTELLDIARGSNEPALMLQAHQAMCVTHLCLGTPAVTRDHMEQAAAIYDPSRHAANTESYGQDPCVASTAFGAVALWLLGRPAEALAASERSLELARRLHQPSSLALATHFAAMLHQCRGDAAATELHAQATIDVAADEGFSFWHAGGVVLRGWARAVRKDGDRARAEAGVADIRRGLDAWLATGSRTYQTYYLGLLADALQRAGRPGDSVAPLDEGLFAASWLPEGLYEAELHRLKGRALVSGSDVADPGEAEACLSRALSVARAQGARWFEWRAANDLASLLRRQGRGAEADDVIGLAASGFDPAGCASAQESYPSHSAAR